MASNRRLFRGWTILQVRSPTAAGQNIVRGFKSNWLANEAFDQRAVLQRQCADPEGWSDEFHEAAELFFRHGPDFHLDVKAGARGHPAQARLGRDSSGKRVEKNLQIIQTALDKKSPERISAFEGDLFLLPTQNDAVSGSKCGFK